MNCKVIICCYHFGVTFDVYKSWTPLHGRTPDWHAFWSYWWAPLWTATIIVSCKNTMLSRAFVNRADVKLDRTMVAAMRRRLTQQRGWEREQEGWRREEWEEVERDGRKAGSREANPTLKLCFWEESSAAPTRLPLCLSLASWLSFVALRSRLKKDLAAPVLLTADSQSVFWCSYTWIPMVMVKEKGSLAVVRVCFLWMCSEGICFACHAVDCLQLVWMCSMDTWMCRPVSDLN